MKLAHPSWEGIDEETCLVPNSLWKRVPANQEDEGEVNHFALDCVEVRDKLSCAVPDSSRVIMIEMMSPAAGNALEKQGRGHSDLGQVSCPVPSMVCDVFCAEPWICAEGWLLSNSANRISPPCIICLNALRFYLLS